jgi:exonuclease SbcC
MILLSLEVASFGALSSAHLELKPGMNVILGPNEAGKSTLFKAMQHLLLTPVNLNKRSFQERIRPLLPVSGGDTIRAALEFRTADQLYRLQKSWGAEAAAELRLPDGARIAEPEAVERRLAELLPVNPGTLRTVLLTVQSGLASTIEELKSDRETVHNLSDLLHRSVLETDGVSVGRFRELLDGRCEQYLKHWDREGQRPERKRGANTRWSRERGSVLEAYYALEDAERHYREIQEKEASFGALTEELELCTRELSAKETRLRDIERGARDAEQRSGLEVRLENTELSLKELQSEFEGWTKSLLRLEALERELPELQQSVQALELERNRVQAYQQKRSLIERFERVRVLGEHLHRAEAELSALLPLPRSQLEQLRNSAAELERLQASLKAGNLSLIFRTREEIDLVTQKDMEDPVGQRLSRDEVLTLEAAGKIEVRHANWSLEIYSGEGEFKKIAEQHDQARTRLEQFLAELGVSSLEEAEQVSKRYEAQRVATDTARALYDQELGSDSFEALKEACGGSEAPPSREIDVVLEELVRNQSRYQKLCSEQEDNRQRIQQLSARYGDKDALFGRIAELAAAKKQLAQTIEGLAPLPAGFTDARTLLEYYQRLKEQVEASRREKIRLESDCRNAESSLPDESSEEARLLVADAREEFDNSVAKAEILVRIQQTAERLLEEIDQSVYEPFTDLMSRYLATLSDNRYRGVSTAETLPAAVIRQDGFSLPYDLLSAGTKDLFALALRLAMAEFFLGEARGFLLLDDPLVDLDPDRQQRAAAVLNRFADRQQLVIFTCQPAHASLLGEAQRIQMHRS